MEWMSKIETVGETPENLSKQIFFLKIVNSICSNPNGNMDPALLRTLKKKMRIRLFSIGSNPMRRGVIQFISDTNGNRPTKFYIGFFKPEFRKSRIIIKQII